MTHMTSGQNTLATYLKRVAIATSVLVNVLTGGNLNQTFSARNWERQRNKEPNIYWLIDLICGKDHCKRCWAYWKVRKEW
jgi:hypothetical protein